MKHTPRFVLENTKINDTTITIRDLEIIEKCQKVLRLEIGSFVDIVNNNKLYNTKNTSINRHEINLEIVQENTLEPEKFKYNITIAQGLPKAGKVEEIISSNTELGVSNFLLFSSEYSQVKTKDLSENKISRLKKIILHSVQQSERTHIPNIEIFKNFEEIINLTGFDKKIILHSRKLDTSKSPEQLKLKAGSNILIIIGPEGGFSDYEIDLVKNNKLEVVFMDIPILRCEHAGFAMCSKLLI